MPMLIRNSVLAGTAALATVILSGCTLSQMIKMAKDQQLTIKPSPLELHGDSVKFEMSAKLPLKMLKKNKIYALTASYNYTDQKVPLGELVFKSADFPKATEIQPMLSKKYVFLYTTEKMNPGNLVLQGVASNINGVQKKTPELPTAKGLITTSRLVQDVVIPVYADHGYNNKEELAPTQVEFFFEQGSSKLRVSEIKGKAGNYLNAFIAQKNATKTVVITGFHSPEGREVRNVKLSEERAKAIEKFYKEAMKKNNYKKKADSIQFVTRSIVQNWKPFKDSLATFNGITAEQKAEVISIIDNSTDGFVKTEEKLTKLKYYPEIFLGLYPRLRTAETEILDILPKKSDATITMLASQIAAGTKPVNALSDKELAYAATLTPVITDKEAIYKAATKQNDSWQAHNNLAVVYLEQAGKQSGTNRTDLVDKAIVQLEIAKNKNQDAIIQANLANAYLLKGNFAYATLAVGNGLNLQADEKTKKTLNTIGGILLIKQGKYPTAINSLNNAAEGDAVAFNRGLAYLLNRDFDKAIPNFDEAVSLNPKYALGYYGLAIAAARKKQESKMVDNLKKAIAADNNLRSRAIGDMEFYEYFGTEAFKNALK